MGRYYAIHDGEDPAVADAVRDHYAPRGPSDAVPTAPISIAVALAEKVDLLAAFFAIGETPTGSGDPYALRRAALGVVRIVRDAGLRLHLRPLITLCAASLPAPPPADAVLAFIVERARVLLRGEGARHDVLDAVFAAGGGDDLASLLMLTRQLGDLLATPDGASLLVAHKRAANILRIETAKDGPHDAPPDPAAFRLAEEQALSDRLDRIAADLPVQLAAADFAGAMLNFSLLRPQLDAFFSAVTVNDPDATLRHNRLRLLHRVGVTMGQVADFSRIEG
jgi:glycyl-tRNA synthetase beta chain